MESGAADTEDILDILAADTPVLGSAVADAVCDDIGSVVLTYRVCITHSCIEARSSSLSTRRSSCRSTDVTSVRNCWSNGNGSCLRSSTEPVDSELILLSINRREHQRVRAHTHNTNEHSSLLDIGALHPNLRMSDVDTNHAPQRHAPHYQQLCSVIHSVLEPAADRRFIPRGTQSA